MYAFAAVHLEIINLILERTNVITSTTEWTLENARVNSLWQLGFKSRVIDEQFPNQHNYTKVTTLNVIANKIENFRQISVKENLPQLCNLHKLVKSTPAAIVYIEEDD